MYICTCTYVYTCTHTCRYIRTCTMYIHVHTCVDTYVHSEYKYMYIQVQVPTVEDLSVASSVEDHNETASISVTEVIVKHTVHNLKIDLHEEGREEGGREGGRERKRERVLC